MRLSDDEIIRLYTEHPNVDALVRKLGITERAFKKRISNIRKKGLLQWSPHPNSPFYKPGAWEAVRQVVTHYEARIELTLENGIIIVGSDAHYWPNEISTAHRGFVRFIKELKPRIVVMNGDVFDGARISRFPRIGWDKTPTVLDELKAAQARLKEIEDVSGDAIKIWDLGNHDGRHENRLAQVAPEYEGVKGFSLKDHFPAWRPCWSVMVNGNTLIKHRWKGGKYATANNTLNSGVSTVTGHLHSLKWWPMTDENGTRYGVDTGTLASVKGPQFVNYTEDSTKDWRAGFAVLTFRNGKLLQPEIPEVLDEDKGEIMFRGTVVSV